MTITDIIQLVSTLGFPIVCCIALAYFCTVTVKENTQAINNMNNSMLLILEYLREEKEE